MNKRTTKWYRKNEAEVMRRLGFKPTRNSGATWIDKADGQNDHCICELKSTDKASFTVKQEYLHTLEANAIEAHKLPVFAFQFINREEVWLCIKESDIEAFKRLVIDSKQEELKSKGFYLSPLLEKEAQKNKSKKVLTNKSSSDIIMGKGKGDRVEAVSFMPEPKPKDNNIDVNTDKIKQNLLARNKYKLSKQTEIEEIQERRKKEQRERKKQYWKRNLNKKE